MNHETSQVISTSGFRMPIIGLGSTVFWYGNPEAERAMAESIDSGLIPMVDCAEMYGNGRCEEAVGRVLQKVGRHKVFLVDKILPDNCTPAQFRNSLETSLKRLGADYFDLYLLHWREKADLSFVAEAMTEAVREGLIRNWGVSNFDTRDMEDLFSVEHGRDCAVDQVLYNLCERGPEYDLFPWLKENGVVPMSYSSLGSSYTGARKRCESDRLVQEICREKGISVSALMLAFNVRGRDLSALFGSSSLEHIQNNLKGIDLDIEPYMDALSTHFPAPDHKVPLAKL